MKNSPIGKQNVCVVVLGDIGRSPRMQYHVKSLVETHYSVDLIGYVESKPLEDLTCNANIRIHPLNPFPDVNLSGVLKYVFKSIWQALTLLFALLTLSKPKFVLCQNPPAIPTLMIIYVYCLLARSKMIIDWHNYTHTILAINSSKRSNLVKMAKFIEFYFGRKAAGNICVTKAMQTDLRDNWGIQATILYDRPPMQFHPISIEEKHELFMHLCNTIGEFVTEISDACEEWSGVQEVTAFTEKHTDGSVIYRSNRPALLISSTSWTPDEDFGILMTALDTYDEIAVSESLHYPRLICIITGKGPLKKYYQALLKEKSWQKVTVLTPWLENSDYPKLLASGDLGVCLHYSSSGLDLPMKVVDMFGSGLPVCAIRFQCIQELLRHGENGFIFETPDELSQTISEWFYDFPSNIALINQRQLFTQNLNNFQKLRWMENWQKNVQPMLE